MAKKKFILAPIPIILVFILSITIFALIYNVFISTELTNKIWFGIVSFFGLVWIYFVISNSTVRISDGEIFLPRKYSMGASFLLGVSFLIALFKKRESLKIADIKSVDIIVGYDVKTQSLESLHQPMKITMKDGEIHTFFMKFYSKKGVMWILRNLKEINPKIIFSKSCKELIELKSPFRMTGTEKADFHSKKKFLFLIFGLLLLLIIIIWGISATGKMKTQTFDIIDITEGYHNNPQIILVTDQGIQFRVDYYEQSTIYSEVNSFLEALEDNPSLKIKVNITYIERVANMRNIINATLSNGQSFKLGFK
jgi:hypothetical protein